MAQPPRRRPSAAEHAEALFKSLTTIPADPKPKASAMPTGKESVSLRIDRDVLDYYQTEGPGWQDRINAALRAAAGLDI